MEKGYSVWKSTLPAHGIPHYYGDTVRTLFIVVAILSFVAMPLWGELVPFAGTIPQVAAPLLLVFLAGLTSAKNELVMIANATVAGISVILLEIAAVLYRSGENVLELFLIRELSAVLLLFALYYALKTIRAMRSGKLGHLDTPLEFMESPRSEPTYTRSSGVDIRDYDA